MTIRKIRFAATLLAMWLAVGTASANPVLARGLSSNSNGQVTASYGNADITFFDLSVDMLDANGNSQCAATNTCYLPNSSGTSLTSRTFGSGEFMVSFQAMLPSGPTRVTLAGLDQEETMEHSFFDLYFEVDLGDGNFMEAALGLQVYPGGPVAPMVTGPGAIGWYPGGPITPNGQSTFLLDPNCGGGCRFTLQSNLTLPNNPLPLLQSNPNLAALPEPSTALLMLGGIGLLAASRLGRTRFRFWQ